MNFKLKMSTVLLCLIPNLAFSNACMVDSKDSDWDIHTKSCYQNQAIDALEFSTLCRSNQFSQSSSETVVVTNDFIPKCPTPFLGACKGANSPFGKSKLPYDVYYYINEGIEHIKKGCVAAGGQWIN